MVSNSSARVGRVIGAADAPPTPAIDPRDSVEALLARYRANGSQRLLASVVERHRAIVEAMAALVLADLSLESLARPHRE